MPLFRRQTHREQVGATPPAAPDAPATPASPRGSAAARTPLNARPGNLPQQPSPEAAPTRVLHGGNAQQAASTALLKRYRPLETRAQGGFGSVEVCLDTRLMRRVAIKRIPLTSPDSPMSETTVAAALAEARTASMLSHPNIVSVIDFTYDARYAYLVMEYVDGMSLAEFLAQVDGQSLTYDECAAVAEALSAALSFAHENGVLHLDIKPANVLIDRKGHIRLTDFGMATLASAAGFGGARGGTVGYMPPEQLEGQTVDERADAFSLAAVLYEALCATSPFRASTPSASLKLIQRGAPTASEALPNIPENTEHALNAALAAAPEERPASVTAFAGEFCANLGDEARGRKSLATLIAKFTADDENAAEPADEPADQALEVDPARGALGSRFQHASHIASAAAAALAVFALSWALLGALGVTGLLPRAAASLALAAAGGMAPQVSSALAVAGVVAAQLGGAGIAISLVPAALVFILGGTWWFVWGRLSGPGSAAMLAFPALAVLTGDPLLGAGMLAAVAAYALEPPLAASSTAAGAVFAVLADRLLELNFAMGLNQLVAAYADPSLLLFIAGAAALAGAGSMLGRTAGKRAAEKGSSPLVAATIALIGVGAALLCALANHMEIVAGSAAAIGLCAGTGCASSIIWWMLMYAFGYPSSTSGGW